MDVRVGGGMVTGNVLVQRMRSGGEVFLDKVEGFEGWFYDE